MTYTESELLPISALQHLLYCRRQCALIHVERLWAENLYTAEGRIMHERVDSGRRESRGDVRLEFAVSLRSLRIGLVGVADVVEFHRKVIKQSKPEKPEINWHPFPVEYKRGRPKKENWDKVQLCAQAICLEEMLGVQIAKGALYYGKTHRRVDVDFNDVLRLETIDASKRLHEMVMVGTTPDAEYTPKCDRCSFLDVCLPKAMRKKRMVEQYLFAAVKGK